jgi:hypothetical protein
VQKLQCWSVPGILRLVQSIPSPKAEPFKRWLAKVGSERLREIADPALGLERSRESWRRLGRSEKWITQHMTGQETRNKLTDYWAAHEVKQGQEFAILTNIIHEEWSGVSVKEHKDLKGLENQNLRDHMSEAELIFTALAELSTRQIAETTESVGLPANKKAAKTGGNIAQRARLELESKTGRKIVTGENYLHRQNQKIDLNLERRRVKAGYLTALDSVQSDSSILRGIVLSLFPVPYSLVPRVPYANSEETVR